MKSHRKKPRTDPNPEKNGIFKGVAAAYMILILHALFIALVGCLVLFFRGMVNYMLWIFLAGTALITFSGYRVYKRMKQERRNLSELLQLPHLNGNSIEVSFLGGVASVKVENPASRALPAGGAEIPLQIEASGPSRVHELTELARLFENDLITREEYEISKKHIIEGISGR